MPLTVLVAREQLTNPRNLRNLFAIVQTFDRLDLYDVDDVPVGTLDVVGEVLVEHGRCEGTANAANPAEDVGIARQLMRLDRELGVRDEGFCLLL